MIQDIENKYQYLNEKKEAPIIKCEIFFVIILSHSYTSKFFDMGSLEQVKRKKKKTFYDKVAKWHLFNVSVCTKVVYTVR